MKELLDHLIGQQVQITWRVETAIPPRAGRLEKGPVEDCYTLRVHLHEVGPGGRILKDLGEHLLHFTAEHVTSAMEASAISQPIIRPVTH